MHMVSDCTWAKRSKTTNSTNQRRKKVKQPKAKATKAEWSKKMSKKMDDPQDLKESIHGLMKSGNGRP